MISDPKVGDSNALRHAIQIPHSGSAGDVDMIRLAIMPVSMTYGDSLDKGYQALTAENVRAKPGSTLWETRQTRPIDFSAPGNYPEVNSQSVIEGRP